MDKRKLTQKQKDAVAKYVKDAADINSNMYTYNVSFVTKEGNRISISCEKGGGQNLKSLKAHALKVVTDRVIMSYEEGRSDLDIENIMKAYGK